MRWIVYLLGLCLTVGGFGVIGLSFDLQGIERGTALAISGTVALVGGIVTLAIGALIGKIETLTAALAPAPAIPALNLPALPLEAAPAAHVPPHEPLPDATPRPGPSAGSIGGAAGAAALAASAYAYREMQHEPERREPEAPPAEAPEIHALRPGFAPTSYEVPAEEPVELAPPVSLKALELEEERADLAPEPAGFEEPASDREALIEAAIRHEEAREEAPEEAPAPTDFAAPADHEPEATELELAAETTPVEAADRWSDDVEPVAAQAAQQVEEDAPAVAEEPVPETADVEPQAPAPHVEEPVETPPATAAPHADATSDPLAWLDRTLSEDPAPPERAAPPPPPPPKPAPAVVGRYTSGGVNYTMYSDGSIEAETPTETLRFASMRELKAFIERRTTGEA